MSKVVKSLAFVVLAVFTLHAEALVVLQQFSLPLSIEHDSNPTLAENNKQSIWLYTASPTYTISAVENQSRWYGALGVRLQRSSDKNISIDREDPNLVAGWERQLERGDFKLVANYNESSTRTTELRTTGLVNQDITATRKSLAAEWTRLLTERLSLALGAELLKSSYDAPGFTGYTTKSIDSSLNYQVNEKLTTFVSAGYVRYKSDSQVDLAASNTQNTQNYLVGVTYLFSPQLDFSMAIGVNHTSSAGSGKLANASINYSVDRHIIKGAMGRSVAASGIGDFQESDSYSLGYSYMLSDKSEIGTAFSYQKNNSLNTNETMFLNSFYSRSLSDQWALRLSLDLRKQKTETQTANGEVAGLTLIYNTLEF